MPVLRRRAAARRGLLLRLRHALAWSARNRPMSVTDREERRVVTVVFADVAGSTALGERIDAEEFRALQGELFALVNAEVERFGGLSEKFVGDAVLAVFGVPLAHDDDAERAVRAALAMPPGFPASRDRDRLRIGVNTGEVVAGRERRRAAS